MLLTSQTDDAITPAELERRRVEFARLLNPDATFVPQKKRSRKPKPDGWRKGRAQRECREIDGRKCYQCIDCEKWLPKFKYYKHRDPGSVCGIQSVCKDCSTIRRGVIRRRAAKRAKVLVNERL